MRHWRKILALSLLLTLTFGQAAYAELIIPPISTVGSTAGLSGQTQEAGGIPGTSSVPGALAMPGATTVPGNASLPGATPAPETTQAPEASAEAQGPGAGAQTAAGGSAQTNAAATAQPAVSEPTVVAEGAVLLDAASGKVLYGKNPDKQFYPASITKVMTALIVLERCNLNDTVAFSSTATTNLESGAVSLNITEGDKLTVEQCLYGLLLKSANEIGNGLAEHVAGSVSAFADLMNAKAKELGCRNTHFANPHGLNDSTHMTTPYDMALIMRAALQNATFRKIDTTTSYQFPATKKEAARTITMGHKMMYTTDSRYYEGIIGGKTGYTSKAGNTLVTGAERNGVRLIAVVMKAKGTQYTDTIAMLDYGFEHYAALTGGSPSAGDTRGGPAAGSQNPVPVTPETSAPSAAPETSAPSEPSTMPAPSTQETTSASAGNTSAAGWKQDGALWYYVKSSGSRAVNEWLTLGGLEYWFDTNGYMATGWRRFTNGDYYYFAPGDGRMVAGSWVEDSGYWYYLGEDGVLLTNTTTPDGYPVDENGIWQQ